MLKNIDNVKFTLLSLKEEMACIGVGNRYLPFFKKTRKLDLFIPHILVRIRNRFFVAFESLSLCYRTVTEKEREHSQHGTCTSEVNI
jgi:hypothetical protein